MSKRKEDIFKIQLDAYEKEIEAGLPETLENLYFVENLEEEVSLAKEAAANYVTAQSCVQENGLMDK